MPRIPRGTTGGLVFHVLNRGNARETVFHAPSDYAAFVDLLREGKERFGVRVYAFCVLPNHFHAVMHPNEASDLSGLMQWWMTSHVRRHHQVYKSSGHIWQGRFKSFPVQEDEHLLTVLRYVLMNPVRAQLSDAATGWRWTSLRCPAIADPWPIAPPRSLASWLTDPIPAPEMKRLRTSVARRSPYGSSEWQEQVAQDAGLASTLRPRGRPKLAA